MDSIYAKVPLFVRLRSENPELSNDEIVEKMHSMIPRSMTRQDLDDVCKMLVEVHEFLRNDGYNRNANILMRVFGEHYSFDEWLSYKNTSFGERDYRLIVVLLHAYHSCTIVGFSDAIELALLAQMVHNAVMLTVPLLMNHPERGTVYRELYTIAESAWKEMIDCDEFKRSFEKAAIAYNRCLAFHVTWWELVVSRGSPESGCFDCGKSEMEREVWRYLSMGYVDEDATNREKIQALIDTVKLKRIPIEKNEVSSD